MISDSDLSSSMTSLLASALARYCSVSSVGSNHLMTE